MIAGSKPVRGSIRIICCINCDATIPIFDFEGETDVDTMGLCSAALCNELDIVLAELDIDEWQGLASKKANKLPARFDGDLDGRDYRVVHILRVERAETPEAGSSFAEFRKRYRAPTVIYSCPCCCDGEGVATSEMTVQAFQEAGGRIRPLKNLSLVAQPASGDAKEKRAGS